MIFIVAQKIPFSVVHFDRFLQPDGTLEVGCNGPGKYINQFLRDNNRKSYIDISTTIAASHLSQLDAKLKPSERLPEAS